MGKFDGILDDVIVNAKAAASVVSKKASDVYDNSKQKLLRLKSERKLTPNLKNLVRSLTKVWYTVLICQTKSKKNPLKLQNLKKTLILSTIAFQQQKVLLIALNAEVMFLKIQSSATAAAQSLMKIKHSFNI